MTYTQDLSRWQRAAALAVEGTCLLALLLAAVGELALRLAPLPTVPRIPAAWQSYIPLTALALLQGAMLAPLRLWRMTWYARLCRAGDSLPSLRPSGRWLAAIGWRWQLWWRRAAGMVIACAPTALLWGYGSIAAQQGSDGIQPLLWLIAGGVALLGGMLAAAIWQCRYALAPLFILRGYPAGAAMALSASAMRGHIGQYINFLGGEAPRLLLCLLLVPAVWIIPAFGRRRTALLLSWMPPAK